MNNVLKSGEKLIEKYTTSASGFGDNTESSNNTYDLYLTENIVGNLTLIIFMKIAFVFQNNGNHRWNSIEKSEFEKKFKVAVSNVWGNRKLKQLPKGKIVYADVRIESVKNSWTSTKHWKVYVKKINKGGFVQSSVNQFRRTVSLDSEDVNSRTFPNKQSQRGVVHEFGHMLGLGDEHLVSSKHKSDISSIMNNGETLRDRHDTSIFSTWLNQVLRSKKYL